MTTTTTTSTTTTYYHFAKLLKLVLFLNHRLWIIAYLGGMVEFPFYDGSHVTEGWGCLPASLHLTAARHPMTLAL